MLIKDNLTKKEKEKIIKKAMENSNNTTVSNSVKILEKYIELSKNDIK